MRWVPDRTRRFRWRPYYRREELDELCEQHVARFLRTYHGLVTYPLATDDLVRLIEQETSELDLYADLASGPDGAEVQGVTTFYYNRPPRVQIARALTLHPRREARLRTTLAHELGHVLLHDFARREYEEGLLPRVCAPAAYPAALCTPATLVEAPGVDWMEWQAGYACGALLMPRSAVEDAVEPVLTEAGVCRPAAGPVVGHLIDRVQGHFLVSDAAAAAVRLRQLRYLRRPERWFVCLPATSPEQTGQTATTEGGALDATACSERRGDDACSGRREGETGAI